MAWRFGILCVSGAGRSGVYKSFLFPSDLNPIEGLSAVIQMDPLCPKYAIFCFPISACLPCDLFSEDSVFPLGDEPLHLSCHHLPPLRPPPSPQACPYLCPLGLLSVQTPVAPLLEKYFKTLQCFDYLWDGAVDTEMTAPP